MAKSNLDIQGHRGCRGLLPENTIPAFENALDLGVTTLELDVVISKDEVVVISHEPFLNHEICKDVDGGHIKKATEKKYNIFELNYEELTQYDCGSLPHPKFPEQKNIKLAKPSLLAMIEHCEKHARATNRALPFYNIEIKRTAEGDNIFHPDYQRFTDLVMALVEVSKAKERITIQCFDLEVLQYLEEQYPNQQQVFLVANKKSIEKNIDELGHKPAIYSPYFKLINKKTVAYCQEQKIKLIPWTINEVPDMKEMIKLGVDGIITDYPDRLMKLVNQ